MQMKYFYKRIVDGKSIQLHAHPSPIEADDIVEITKAEYNALFEEIAKHAKDVRTYTEQVRAGTLQLTDVPEDCRAEVEKIINRPEPEPPNNDYGVDNDTYNAIIDDYTLDLMESGLL